MPVRELADEPPVPGQLSDADAGDPDNGIDPSCTPTGDTGTWSAATGNSGGPESWLVDLGAFAGKTVELSFSYASDETVQMGGVFIDDVIVSTGEGSTSFEGSAFPFDGWSVAGPPATSPGNDTDWFIGTAADTPPPAGAIAAGSFKPEPEILKFLADNFGTYPFSAAGGILDDVEGLGFALETQTRPIYSRDFFTDPIGGDNVVVHENAHQWYGDRLAVERWQHIWLNEGFATYAEWLWSEHEGLDSPETVRASTSASSPRMPVLGRSPIGDPTLARFDPAVLPAVHDAAGAAPHVGDDVFFRLLKRWAHLDAGGTLPPTQFIALAEKLSGQDLDDLFETWLFTPSKPVVTLAATQRSFAAAGAGLHAPSAARGQLQRYGGDVVDRLTD